MINKTDVMSLVPLFTCTLICLCVSSCMPKFVDVHDDPEFAAIDQQRKSMSKEEAIETVRSCIDGFNDLKSIEVSESGYTFVVRYDVEVQSGYDALNKELIYEKEEKTYGQDLVFDQVLALESSGWGDIGKRHHMIYITLSEINKRNNEKYTTLECHSRDRNRLMAALLVLCPNVK